MGLNELSENGITQKILYFLTDRMLTPSTNPLRRVRKSRILLYVALQLAAFGATFSITQTIGGLVSKNEYLPRADADSRGRVSCYYLVLDPVADTRRATNALLPCGAGNPGPSHGISFRACLEFFLCSWLDVATFQTMRSVSGF